MSRRAMKGINWADIANRIPNSEKNMYAALKSRSDGYLQRMSSLPDAPMKIDWAMYKQQIPIAGMVDKFQKEYDSLKIPYPVDNYTAKIEAYEKEVMDHIANFLEESKQRIAQYQAKGDKLKEMIPFEQMTMEDYAECYPEDAINIDRPTMWPHLPDLQPDDREVETPMPKHH